MFLHLEITTKCALKCPSCPRTIFPGEFRIGELSLDAIKNSIDSDIDYDIINLCGAYGDPIYHSQFHDVIKLLKTVKKRPPIVIATNGSYRSEAWWKQTAELLESRDRVTFGVDGLEDTNHLYRQGSDWNSIMTGITTLKKFGFAQVNWQWILFRYNEHQLREGKSFAESLGIDQFFVVDSYRDNGELNATKSIEEALAECQDHHHLPPL